MRPRMPGSLGRSLAAAKRLIAGSEVSQPRIRRFVAAIDSAKATESWSSPGSLAIVVPCYGHAPHLSTMFDSIVQQTRRADEVIFVDDASPDDTAGILARLIDSRPDPVGLRFDLLRNGRNVGQAASLNRAIEAAQSDLVMVLNDDDYLMHDAVAVTLERFAAHPDLALIGAHSIHFAGDGALLAAARTSTAYPGADVPLVIHPPTDVFRYRRYIDLNMTHSGSCFRKKAWAVVGGYQADKRRRVVPFSDRDFQLRINALWPVGVAIESPLAFWRADSSLDRELNS